MSETDPEGRPPEQPTGRPAGLGPPPAWWTWAPGTRVVVRRRLPEGGFSDVLGDVLSSGAHGVRILTRTGEVDVPAGQIALGKPIPPPPPRRAPRSAPPDG
ncbi:hypothetical protein [Actinotalea sp. K2]|uniref:putative acetyltransferase n=1 Tax=Actinotalea sp. K2 TaxID=2939438 RepID=UPI002016F72A|nr:hypothetical protein [Actinotalea sp. K2]